MARKIPGRALDSNTSVSVANISFGSNVTVNTSTILLGNSTVNTAINSTSVSTKTIIANGSFGSNGQLLASNGTALYWTEPPASTNTDAQYSWTNNHTFSAALTIANTLTVGNSTVNTVINATSISGNGSNITSVDAATVGGNTASTLRTYTDTVSATAFTNAASRADSAYSNATSYADTKAATAYSNATSYADTVSGTAFTNAASRADSAYSNAVAYAASNTYVNNTFLPLAGGTLTGNLTINAVANVVANLAANNVVIRGDIQIDGNLTVSGTSVTLNAASLAVEDNMIYLNNGSQVTHPDLGFAGNYNDGTYKHAGFFRDATDATWKVFDGYTPEPDASAYIDTSNASFRIANFTANVITANSFTGNGASVTSVDAATVGGNTASTLRSYSDTVAATAYSNATAYSANGSNISSGTVAFARLPALYLGTTQIQSTGAAQAVSGITTLAASNATITGDVYIGTSSPTSSGKRLAVHYSSAADQVMTIRNTNATGLSSIRLEDESGSYMGDIGYNNDSNVIRVGGNGGVDVHFAVSNVGIGTATPAYKLDVNKGSAGNIARFTDGVAQTLVLQTADTNGFIIKNDNSGYISLNTGGDKLRIAANGNIGVSNTAPVNKLVVNGNFEVNQLILKTAATEEAGPLSTEPARSEYICFVTTTVNYAAIYPGTEIYETNTINGYTTVKVGKTTSPVYGTFTANAGFLYSSNMPVNLLGPAAQQATAPLSWSSSTFFHYTNRFNPITFYVYSPYGVANVALYAYSNTSPNTGILGTVETSNVAKVGSICTLTSNTIGYHYIKSDVPVVITVAGNGGDNDSLKPTSRIVYNRYTPADSNNGSKTIYGGTPTFANSVWANNSLSAEPCVAYSDQPLNWVTIADGAGGDTAQGIGLEYLGDTYAYGGVLSDFTIVAPYSNTTIKASYWDTGSNTWIVWDTISLPYGHPLLPSRITRDGTNGPGVEATLISGAATNMASGANTVWSFSGSKPFAIWVNDEGDDETHLVGWSSKNAALNRRTSDYVYQAANGNVGIANTAPAEKLHVQGNIVASGSITASYSDERLKIVIKPIENAVDKLGYIDTIYYRPNDLLKSLAPETEDKVSIGVTAQSVEKVFPELIVPSAIDKQYSTVQYDRLVPVLIAAIKEQQKQIEELKAKVGG